MALYGCTVIRVRRCTRSVCMRVFSEPLIFPVWPLKLSLVTRLSDCFAVLLCETAKSSCLTCQMSITQSSVPCISILLCQGGQTFMPGLLYGALYWVEGRPLMGSSFTSGGSLRRKTSCLVCHTCTTIRSR